MMRSSLLATTIIAVTALNAEARTLFVSNEKGNSISIVDGDTLELIKEVPVGQRPRGIELGKDGKFLYICASDDDTIEVMDTSTYDQITIPAEQVESYVGDETAEYEASDSVGLTGIELTQEELLRGTKGQKHIEVDAFERARNHAETILST